MDYAILTTFIFSVLVAVWAQQGSGPRKCHENIYINEGEGVILKNPSYPYWDSNLSPMCNLTLYPRTLDTTIDLKCTDLQFSTPYEGLRVIVNEQYSTVYSGPFEETGDIIEIQQVTSPWGSGGRLMCNMGAQPSCQCGWRFENKEKIVGGVEPTANKFPSMAALVNVGYKSISGGAAIIARRVALTSASVIWGQNPSNFGLLVGDHNWRTSSDTDAAGLYRIIAFIPHEQYQETRMMYDIGLIITEIQIEFSPRVGPSCLPFSVREDLIGSVVEALGWGATQQGGQNSDVLQVAPMLVVPPENCEKTFGLDFSRDQQMCLKWAGHSSCTNDAGGPMYYTNAKNNRLYSVSVISYAINCEGLNVGPKVSYFLDWINQKVPSANFCVR